MRLIIGGFCQGKSSYAAARFPGYAIYDENNYATLSGSASEGVILNHLHLIIRELLKAEKGEQEIREIFLRLGETTPDIVFISDEIGCGIVPIQPEDRQWREVTGRVLIALAEKSREVIRITAGIPQVIKKTVQVHLIRHGKTPGNLERRYIGRTDESLSEAGRKDIQCRKYPPADFVFTSPMKRCRETGEIIYPSVPKKVIPEFRETDFGAFEGKKYDELKDIPAYVRWLESGGTQAFPEGESREKVAERVKAGFRKVQECIRKLSEETPVTSVALVVHGGTIMTLLSELFRGNYYDYQVRNGEGYSFELSYDGLCSGLRAGSYHRRSGELVPSGSVDWESDSEVNSVLPGEGGEGDGGDGKKA